MTQSSAVAHGMLEPIETIRARQRVRETATEFAAFGRRIIRAHGRRVAAGDIAALGSLAALSTELDAAMADAVTRLRADHGYSWADIGRELGITRAAACNRFGGAA
jgi:hypothetical protein